MFEHLKEALVRAKTDLAKVETDLALKKERREARVVKAKEKLAKMEKRAKKKTMEKYKASINFIPEKAWTVVVFHTLTEFYTDHHVFNEKAFKEGYKLGKYDYHT